MTELWRPLLPERVNMSQTCSGETFQACGTKWLQTIPIRAARSFPAFTSTSVGGEAAPFAF